MLTKMLIVDDESLSRCALRKLISINIAEIEIVGEAESGNQAIEMAQKLSPQIIAMDIKLPGVNGLEASEIIIHNMPGVNILVISAYDSFNYVQKALDIGAIGYLLKPFKNEEVIEKLKKVLENIRSDKDKETIALQVENKIKIVKPFVEKELVSAIARGYTDVSEIESYDKFLQQTIDEGYFMLISFVQSNTERISDSVRNKISMHKIMNVVERHLPILKKCYFGNPIGNIIVILFSVDEESSQIGVIKESVIIAQEIKHKIMVMTGINAAIGIGNFYKGIENLQYSYNEAFYALRRALEDDCVKHSSMCKNDQKGKLPVYPLILEGKLLEELKTGNFTYAKELADELVAEFTGDSLSIDMLKEYIIQFIAVLKRTIFAMGVGINDLMIIGRQTDINNLQTSAELSLWCKNNAYTIIGIACQFKQKKNSAKAAKAYEYININFYKDITLEIVAEEVRLSPQYLSKIFKEETGVNFSDYVNEKKINYAKILLKSKDKNIKEISRTVGYSDVNYFRRLFKKATGMTITQYKDYM